MKSLRFLCVLLFVSLPAARAADLTVGAPETVSETRISRTVFEYVMRASVTNGSAITAKGVTATCTSTSPRTTVVEGTLLIGNVAAQGSAASTDTFTIAHDRTVPFDPAVLQWTITKVPGAPAVTAPDSPTNAAIVTLTGTAEPGVTVEITGITWPVTGTASGTGAFSIDVPLQENRINKLFVTALNATGRSEPVPVDIIHDAVAPSLFIDFPADGAPLTNDTITVAGRVGDMLSGFKGLKVTVNGQPANVDVGIGQNGTFERSGVPLAEGDNPITVIATDVNGNSTTRPITIKRVAITGPRMAMFSGDQQTARIHQILAAPIVVKMTNADGTPFAGKVVTFDVTRSDGRLSATGQTGTWGLMAQVLTGADGFARAHWALGGDAGCGNNRVSVTSKDISGTIFFCASAQAAPPSQINIGSGNNQRAEAGGLAPESLRAWVSDSCNGVMNLPDGSPLPVTFTVKQGGGKVNGAESATVNAEVTGHAQVSLTLGPEAGTNIVEANYPGNPNLPATFICYGVARDPSKPTTFTGLVLDNTSQPIGGARCQLAVGGSFFGATTDKYGRFTFNPSLDTPPSTLHAGKADLFVNGLPATSLGVDDLGNPIPIPAGSFPSLSFSPTVVPNAENALTSPVLLPRLNPNNEHTYDGTTDLVLTCEGIAGLKMTIKAGSMHTPDGWPVSPANTAKVSLNQVHADNVPMPVPDGASPPFAWTLQPAQCTFDPPIQIEYPNMSGLPAGSIAYFLTYNHDTEKFEIFASGHVTNDGSTILTDPGAGLTVSGWGCNCPPYAVTGDCKTCENPPPQGKNGPARNAEEDCEEDPCKKVRSILEERAAEFPSIFNDQVACLAQKICAAREQGAPWADDFILDTLADDAYKPHSLSDTFNWLNQIYNPQNKPLFEFQIPGTETIISLADPVSSTIALGDGSSHFVFGLLPSFYRHCANRNGRHHNQFLTNAVRPCFHEINNIGALEAWLAGWGASFFADFFGSFFEVACPIEELLGFNPQSPAPPQLAAGNQSIEIPASALVDPTLSQFAKLQITSSAPDFFVRPGAEFQLHVTRNLSNGLSQDISAAANGTRYFCTWAPEHVTISTDGLVRVQRAPSPLARLAAPLRIFAFNNREIGIIQRGLIGNDADGDLLDDSAEVALGFNPGSQAELTSDSDGDGLTDFQEAILGNNPRNKDSDGDGINDLSEELQESDPTDFESTRGRLSAGSKVSVNGQLANSSGGGAFTIRNISAPDQFGPSGPGSTPDFVSDDFVRAIVVIQKWGRTFYAFSDFFRVRQQETLFIENLTFTDKPPKKPDMLAAVPDAGTLTAIGQMTQVHVTATYADKTTDDVTPATDWTSYRVSNPAVATVDANGLVTARGKGIAYITAVNEGTTSVAQVTVVPGDPLTTVKGFLRREDGSPAAGAVISLSGLGLSATVATDGSFTIINVPTTLGTLTLSAVVVESGSRLVAVAKGLNPLPGTAVDAGILTLAPFVSGPSVKAIAAGDAHTVSLKTDGSLWAWGDNSKGQLGDGTTLNKAAPVPIGTGSVWTAVAAGSSHTVARKSDGSLWAWGYNSTGQLGDGTTGTKLTPVPVGSATDWAEMGAGNGHTIARKIDGSLWAWGSNQYGQLGDGTSVNKFTPVPIGFAQDWVQLASGGFHTVARKIDGRLFAWGGNFYGQLGDGTTINRPNPVPVGTGTQWANVAAGTAHSVASKTDGTLWAWGFNSNGQLGDGTVVLKGNPVPIGSANDWADLAAGGSHTVARTIAGSFWAWGDNSKGQLGDGTTVNKPTPVPVGLDTDWTQLAAGGLHNVALKADGSVWAWGNNTSGQRGDLATRVQVGTGKDWAEIGAGSQHTVGLKTDGSLWAWGFNSHRELGDGTTDFFKLIPVPSSPGKDWIDVTAGGNYTVARKGDGSVWSWGYNVYGQLGKVPGTPTTPLPIGTAKDWAEVAAGFEHTLARKTDGSLWAWGDNHSFQLGDGTTVTRFTPVPIGSDKDWVAVSAGFDHSMARKTDGSLWGWGASAGGPIFNLSPAPIGTDKNWAEVTAGFAYTVARKTDDSLWAWGENYYGQLGDGTTDFRSDPVPVGTDKDWAQVAAGFYHTVARKTDGSLWAWGYGGLMGNGPTEDKLSPTRIGTGNDWSNVWANATYTVARRVDGSLWAWGTGSLGAAIIGPIGNTYDWGLPLVPSPAPAAPSSIVLPARPTPVGGTPIANAPPSAAGSVLRITSLAQRATGAEFQFPTEAGARYRLEGSADLQTWTVLLEDLAGTGGVLQVRDPAAATFPRYFYRVRRGDLQSPNPPPER